MTDVTVIGTGNMGTAIAAVAAKAGAHVQVVARDVAKAEALAAKVTGTAAGVGDALSGSIVIFAVPFDAVDELVQAYGSALDDKIVVDITNPVDSSTFDGLTVPADGSAAADLAAKLPSARVVKAFNTNFASTLSSGAVGDAATTVLVAGDDAEAKKALIDLVVAGGLAAEDAGSLKRARELESIGFLQITLAASEKIAWTGGFALTR
jgi:predicted dinucleotide-binding enzyme